MRVSEALMPKHASRRVAFQGELGAFSHAAIEKLLGSSKQPLPCPSFAEVFEALRTGHAAQAVVPIENTLHGSVHENYDHLLDCDYAIVGETSVRIAHQLITMPGVRMRDVRKVYSHPVALNQCRRFFASNRQIEPVPFYDTAGSVKMLMNEEPPGAAAIASAVAADIYGGVIRKRDIEDDRQNFTRFFLLSKQSPKKQAQGAWKTSLVFSMANRPGALFKALACFALRDLSLTKIESRPLRGKPWEYLFYVDFLGSTADPPVKSALSHLAELTELFKVLGCYRPTP
jgi:prephenate dehydratase